MIAVILDTNVLYSDPWLAKEDGQRLLRLADENTCLVLYPQVVIDELLRQRNEAAQDSHNEAMAGVTGIGKAGIDVKQLSADLTSIHQRIGAELDGAFARLLEKPNVEALPVPALSVTSLLQRDLARRRPFTESSVRGKKISAGFRDTVIWETVLEVVSRVPPYSEVFFVSSDKVFRGDKSNVLHPDLVSDLVKTGRGANAVTLAPSITPVLAKIASLLAASEDPKPESFSSIPAQEQLGTNISAIGDSEVEVSRSIAAEEQIAILISELRGPEPSEVDLVAAATDGLYTLINADVSMSINPRGDYDYPDFAQFSVPGLEDAYISEIDQTTGFTFIENPSNPDERIATAEATLTIVGSLDTFAVINGNLEGITVLREFNDYYMEVSSEVRVLVEITLDVEGGQALFTDIILKDQPVRPGPDDVPLDFAAPEDLK